jgi:predicted DNA binding CopG/RHH family protein
MKKEYNFTKMKAEKNPYATKKRAVGINLSHQVVDYFKKLSVGSGVPYQTLIDMYLLDCVKTKKKLKMDWAA